MLMLKKIPTPSPYSQTLQKEVEVINFSNYFYNGQ